MVSIWSAGWIRPQWSGCRSVLGQRSVKREVNLAVETAETCD